VQGHHTAEPQLDVGDLQDGTTHGDRGGVERMHIGSAQHCDLLVDDDGVV
jgi:hypothetical protein